MIHVHDTCQKMGPWEHIILFNSRQFTSRSGTRTWNLRIPDVQIHYSDINCFWGQSTGRLDHVHPGDMANMFQAKPPRIVRRPNLFAPNCITDIISLHSVWHHIVAMNWVDAMCALAQGSYPCASRDKPHDKIDSTPYPTMPSLGLIQVADWILRATFFRENINIYLHLLSFLHTNKTQLVEIPPRVRQGPACST